MMKDIFLLLLERKDFFVELIFQHIIISLSSIIIAIIIGGCLGILINEYTKYTKVVLNIINFIYTIPSISALGFLIPFTGIGNITAIITLTIYALLPMVRNTYTGFSNIPDNLIETAKAIGSTKSQILINVKFPLALPIITSGIKNMAVMTVALAGIASFIGAGGLGVAVYRGITTNNSTMTIAGSLLIAILAIIFDFVFGIVEKIVSYKKKTSKLKIFISVILILSLFISFFNIKPKTNTINIATKPMTEQYIIGEILDILITNDTNLNVNVTYGVGGGTSNIHPAILNQQFDIYPEYTGTIWNTILKKDTIFTNDKLDILQQEYENINLKLKGFYGFDNTYSIAVRKEIAEKYNLETYSDLAKISNELIFGSEYDFFEREDGYKEISKVYGFNFKSNKDLDIGLKYQAINDKKIDAMSIFTTDGQLYESDVKVLIDDKHFYPSYQCMNVVRNDILNKYPELEKVFEKVSGLINDAKMAELNYKVEIEKQDPKNVAQEFLKSKGII